MKKKIYQFIDNEEKFIPVLASEIVKTFKEEAKEDNIDYSFTINQKTGDIKVGDKKESNTFFYFDAKEGTVLNDFKNALFGEDLEDIIEGSLEEKKIMEDTVTFLQKVGKEIASNYKEDLTETIRRTVLGNKYKVNTVPLKTIEVITIDIADYSSIPESNKYLLEIGKVPDTQVNTDEIVKLVQNRQDKTGMDVETIFSIEKRAGNPLFDKVLSIKRGSKFLNEISIYFFVDYSVEVPKIS